MTSEKTLSRFTHVLGPAGPNPPSDPFSPFPPSWPLFPFGPANPLSPYWIKYQEPITNIIT